MITNYPLGEGLRLKSLSHHDCHHQKYADQLSKTGLSNSQVLRFPFELLKYNSRFQQEFKKKVASIKQHQVRGLVFKKRQNV